MAPVPDVRKALPQTRQVMALNRIMSEVPSGQYVNSPAIHRWELRVSMIPWNQLNAGIVKTFKTELACGSVVKLTFRKYMGWPSGEPKRRSLSHNGWNGVLWIVKSLRAGNPVRCFLKMKDHYVGIVGCRGRSVHREAPEGDAYKIWEFLVIDPWPGGAATGSTTIQYAGVATKFPGIASLDGTKLMYDSYEITDVEGILPF